MTATQEHAVSLSKRQSQDRMEFHNPPVVETAIGFYFQKIEGWNVLHHGALWDRFRPHYPDSEFLPTIVDNPHQPTISLDFSSVPIRVAFVDKTKTKLVQTQNGLLLHNWRKTPDVSAYQHYETTTRDQLRQDWNTFKAFCETCRLRNPWLRDAKWTISIIWSGAKSGKTLRSYQRPSQCGKDLTNRSSPASRRWFPSAFLTVWVTALLMSRSSRQYALPTVRR